MFLLNLSKDLRKEIFQLVLLITYTGLFSQRNIDRENTMRH